MEIFVINLDKDTERLAAVNRQLCRLGIHYEKFSAINAKEIESTRLLKNVNRFRWWCAVGRPVRIGEIGCAMSHYAIYKKMQQDDLKVVCVLEDDVIIDGRFKTVLEFAERIIDANKPQVFLLSNHTGVVGNDKDCHIVACKKDMYTEGYAITAPAAKALLKANFPLQTPCDWWGRWVKRGLIEVYHVFPTVCSQNQDQYESGTVDVNSFNVKNLTMSRFVLHKCLRLVGKILDEMMNVFGMSRKLLRQGNRESISLLQICKRRHGGNDIADASSTDYR